MDHAGRRFSNEKVALTGVVSKHINRPSRRYINQGTHARKNTIEQSGSVTYVYPLWKVQVGWSTARQC